MLDFPSKQKLVVALAIGSNVPVKVIHLWIVHFLSLAFTPVLSILSEARVTGTLFLAHEFLQAIC